MIPENEVFSIELTVLDLTRVSRSVMIGNQADESQEVSVTDTCAFLPSTSIERRVWLNLVVDVRNLYNSLYKGCTYRSIEGIDISGVCKVRRVMTLTNN